MACVERRTLSCPIRQPATAQPKRWNRPGLIPDSHPLRKCRTRSRPSRRLAGHSPRNLAYHPKGCPCQQGLPAIRSTSALPRRTVDGSDTPQRSRSEPRCSKRPRRPSTPPTQSRGCRQPGLHEPIRSRQSRLSSLRRHRSPDQYR